jgi:hypothetical protein
MYTGSEIMIIPHSRAETIIDRAKPTSYFDSTSNNTLNLIFSKFFVQWVTSYSMKTKNFDLVINH